METEYFDKNEDILHLTNNPNCLFVVISGKVNLRIVETRNEQIKTDGANAKLHYKFQKTSDLENKSFKEDKQLSKLPYTLKVESNYFGKTELTHARRDSTLAINDENSYSSELSSSDASSEDSNKIKLKKNSTATRGSKMLQDINEQISD